MVSSKYLLIVNRFNNASDLALYTEMKEGMLAPKTDYASRPLRGHLKRKEKYIYVDFFILYLSQRVLRKQIKCFCRYSRMPLRPKSYAPPSVYLKGPSFFLIFQALSSNPLKRYESCFTIKRNYPQSRQFVGSLRNSFA
jgi:hypothetical protein